MGAARYDGFLRTVRLLLFDVDGTLLTCGPQVQPLFAAALEEVFGTAGDLAAYDFAGKTDPQIVLELMTGAGVPLPRVRAELGRMREVYVRRLKAILEPRAMCLMPGVLELLQRLAPRRELTLGLLTGNWEGGARAKLRCVGLNGYFPFGAFGDDGVERSDLVPAALDRAQALAGYAFRPRETLIIGDTPLDVACARAHGVPVLAVATGRSSVAELEAAGAHWVAPDLPAAARLLPVLAG